MLRDRDLGSVTRFGACFGGLDHRLQRDYTAVSLQIRLERDRLRATSTDPWSCVHLVVSPSGVQLNRTWDQREGVLIPDSLAGQIIFSVLRPRAQARGGGWEGGPGGLKLSSKKNC